ncbi:TIGR00730 family Rossman fold protein [uncultured Slackia sp.]|uniref:LOG family protein n=1 Tax=uncultured Slackia sp. TaxID=665903 RepID=UPI0025D7E9AE|nr:TIGR00730 family Rossman fold protein [uncultured Slackia sp.]
MNIAVYCGSSSAKNPHFTECARELGEWIARNGHTLVYGGSSIGLMGVVSRAALDAGGKVYGVEPRFFIEAGVAQHDLTHLYVTDDMTQRKAKMIELADTFVAIPGGVGTLEEISEIFSRIRLGLGPDECFLMNIDGFYNPLRDLLRSMFDQGFLSQVDIDRIHFPESVEEFAGMLDESQKNPAQHLATAPEMIAQ